MAFRIRQLTSAEWPEPLGALEIALQVSVRDTGIGMTPEQCGRLFQLFSQADTSTSRDFGGTGLGLAISKSLVEQMGGRIWVESEPGVGSTFLFTTRFGEQAQGTGRREGPQASGTRPDETAALIAELAGLRVLLVEDNEMNQELTLALLRDAHIEVVLAENGQLALDRLATDTDFDGILMDCQMPVMDGYTASWHIRAEPRYAELPILAMTANTMAGDREKALAAGMLDHIAKPLNVKAMFTTMRKWMLPSRRAGVGTRAAVPEVAVAAAAPTDDYALLQGIEVKVGLAVTMNNETLYRRMLGLFIQNQGGFADAFAAARQDADPSAPTRVVHTFKGNAGNIGARTQQAAALEAGAPS